MVVIKGKVVVCTASTFISGKNKVCRFAEITANCRSITLTLLCMPKQIIKTDKAPQPIGPYSQAVKVDNLLFLSGQVAINPATNELITGDITAEARQIMENLKAVLTEARLTFEHVVKTTIYLTDMSFFGAVNDVYGSYFNGDFPARETVAVKALPKGVEVEISMVAVVNL
jgi:2-iminobutanoate/2-iminopropanoate deaminase